MSRQVSHHVAALLSSLVVRVVAASLGISLLALPAPPVSAQPGEGPGGDAVAVLVEPLCTRTASHLVDVRWPESWAVAGDLVAVHLAFGSGESHRERVPAEQLQHAFSLRVPAGGTGRLVLSQPAAEPARLDRRVTLPPCDGLRRERADRAEPRFGRSRADAAGLRAMTRTVTPARVTPSGLGELSRIADDFGAVSELQPCRGVACEIAGLFETDLTPLNRTLTTSWTPTEMTNYPLDPQIAASRTHLVISTIGRIGFYEKNGTLVTHDRHGNPIDNPVSEKQFFGWLSDVINPHLNLGALSNSYENGKLKYGIDTYYDNRVVFDPYRNRFWMVALARNSKAREGSVLEQLFRRSKLVVAVSTTEDPRDPWHFYWFDAFPDDGQCLDVCGCDGIDFVPGAAADYPNVGVNQDAVLITNTAVDNNKLNLRCLPFDDRAHIFATRLDAGAFAHGNPGPGDVLTYSRFTDADGKTAHNVIQPALHHTATPVKAGGRPIHALSTLGGDQAVVWGFYPKAPWIERVAVDVDPYFGKSSHPEKWAVPQKTGPGLAEARRINMGTNVGNLVLDAAYRDGRLHGVWTDCRKWGGEDVCSTSIRLFRADVSGFPGSIPTSSASGFVDRTFGKRNKNDDPEGATNHYGWSAVEVNGAGHVVVSYNRTGETLYPEGRYSIYRADASDISPSALLAAGEYSLGGEVADKPEAAGRLDVTGSAVDPYDDAGVWIAQPHAVQKAPDTASGVYRLVVGRVFGKGRPDLAPLRLDHAFPDAAPIKPAGQLPSGPLDLSLTLRNQGDAQAPATKVRFVLSTNALWDSLDHELAMVDAGPVGPGEEIVVEKDGIQIPGDLPPSHSFWVLVVADDGNQVEEYSEGNNFRAFRID